MSVMFLLQQFAPGVVLGALVTFGVAMIARWVRSNWGRQLAFAAAIGGGYAAGHAKSVGWPSLPPGDATHWLLFSALAAIVLGFCYGVSRDGWIARSTRVTSFLVLILGTLLLVLTPKFKYGWTAGQGALWVAALTLAASVMGWAVDAAVHNRSNKFTLLWLLAIGGGTSVALAISGSMLLGQLAAVLAAAVFGLIVASVAGAITERAIVPGIAAVFSGLIACGYFYAELPWTSALLLVVAPVLSLVVRGETTTRREILRAIVVAVPVGAAVALAFRASPPVDYY